MLILDSTTKTIEVVLGQTVTANQLPVATSYRDITTTDFSPKSNLVTTNNTTETTIVPAPAASTQRVIDYIGVYNADTTAKDVTIQIDVSGANFILIKAQLGAGERLEYQEGSGWSAYTSNGSIKSAATAGVGASVSGAWTQIVLGADVINNNAVANTMQDVTGLSFGVLTNASYIFQATLFMTSSATTNGGRIAVNGPSISSLGYTSSFPLNATTNTITNASAFDLPASSSVTIASATGNIGYINGFFKPAADGTLILRFASELANTPLTIKAGSILEYQQVL